VLQHLLPPPITDDEDRTCLADLLCSGSLGELPGRGSGFGFWSLPFVLAQFWLGKCIVQLYSHTRAVILTHAGLREADVWFVGLSQAAQGSL